MTNHLSELFNRPLFTSREARSLGVHPSRLAYYAKKGIITRVSRGVYRVEIEPDIGQDFRWADLAEAIHGIHGGVICLISALAIYDLTEEIPRQHWIGVRHGTNAVRRAHMKIVRFRNLELGKTTIVLDGVTVPIFDRERTIVDAFRLLSRETAIKALKMALSSKRAQKLNLIKLQEYAKKLRVNIDPFLITATT